MIDSRQLRTPVMLVLHPRGFVTKQRMGSKASGCRHWGFLLHSLYQSQRHWRPGTDWDARTSTISKPNPWIFPRLQFCRSRLSSWNNQPSTARNLSPDPDQNSVWALPKTFKAEKLAQGKSGFVAAATRWVVERSNGTLQVPGQNFEWTLDHARAKLNLCFIRLMLKRLAEA